MQCPITYRVAGSLRWRQGVCQNIGGGGMSVAVGEPLQARAILELVLRMTGTPPFQAMGQLRRQTKTAIGVWHIGVELLAMDEPQRFTEVLCERLLEGELKRL